MGINPKYIPLNYLQQYFVDKDTGFPLSGGIVTFYKDNQRTVLKPVYELRNNSGEYEYVELTNPLILSSVGTFADIDSNDITVYAYPYDENGDIDLYYITVESFDSVAQFTREGVPNVAAEIQPEEKELLNYVSNGQFLIHNDISATDSTALGQINQGITNIAPGGWTFERPPASTALDYVIFEQEAPYTTNPTGNPRYLCRIKCTSPNLGDSYKNLCIKFDDVNKFASATQEFTFSFTAQANLVGTSVSVKLIKNYGTGGSPEDVITIDTIPITTSSAIYNESFIVGENTGKIIGDQNDDFLKIVISLPPTISFDITFTDIIFTLGNVNINSFPIEPNSEFIYKSIAGGMPVPAYDGSDLYCNLRLTKTGLEFDHSDIGSLLFRPDMTVPVGYLAADGSNYSTNAYSSDGIPYKRLQQIYWLDSLGVPKYGTGANYLTGLLHATADEFNIINNSKGSVTAIADGTVSTGFTFSTIHTGHNGFYVKAYVISNNTFMVEDDYPWTHTVTDAIDPGSPEIANSGFAFILMQRGSSPTIPFDDRAGNVNGMKYRRAFVVNPGSGITAGHYIRIYSATGTAAVNYYIWFRINGAGTDPAVPGTNGSTRVDLLSTDTTKEVCEKIQQAIMGWNVSRIQTIPAASITTGSYFTVHSTIKNIYVWYRIDGIGTDPAVAFYESVRVDLLSTDDARTVAQKTQKAINSKYFAVLDARGLFFRGYDDTGIIDTDASTRWSLVPGLVGNQIGTMQLDALKEHIHYMSSGSTQASPANLDNCNTMAGWTNGWLRYTRGASDQLMEFAGSSLQNIPVNTNVRVLIKY